MRFLYLLLLCVGFVGCCPTYVDFFPCHDDGSRKPTIGLLPAIDRSGGSLCWSLADEITGGIRNTLCCDGQVFIPSPEQMQYIVEKMPETDFLGKDLSFARKFAHQDFIAIIEIMEHREIPYQRGMGPLYPNNCQAFNNVLFIKVRLKIIDLRNQCPRVAFQEIIEGFHKIPCGAEYIDYSTTVLGTKEFALSPYGLAHQRLIQYIAKRVEEVVVCAPR